MFMCAKCGVTTEVDNIIKVHFANCPPCTTNLQRPEQEPMEEEVEEDEEGTPPKRFKCDPQAAPMRCPNCNYLATSPDALEVHFSWHCPIKYVVERVYAPRHFTEYWFHCRLCQHYKTKSMPDFDDHMECTHKCKVAERTQK